jgi:hypothetical protein
MKKFKLIALLICTLGVCSAFVSQRRSFSPTYYGWSIYPGSGPYCYYRLLDWGAECDAGAYGQLCTIGGGGFPAYASSIGCQYHIQTELLYRIY